MRRCPRVPVLRHVSTPPRGRFRTRRSTPRAPRPLRRVDSRMRRRTGCARAAKARSRPVVESRGHHVESSTARRRRRRSAVSARRIANVRSQRGANPGAFPTLRIVTRDPAPSGSMRYATVPRIGPSTIEDRDGWRKPRSLPWSSAKPGQSAGATHQGTRREVGGQRLNGPDSCHQWGS